MDAPRPPLTVFTPLPPERNGIADYAAGLIPELARHYDCRVACAEWLAEAPPGVPVLDPLLAHRSIPAGGRLLHQIGNNAGHRFVLRALRRLPGVTTLHDAGLLHLYDMAGEPAEVVRAGMASGLPGLAATYARHVREDRVQSRANYLLFDLATEVLARSRAVVVHSAFACNRLRLNHGEEATRHVVVIPHALAPQPPPPRPEARRRLGLAPDEVVVLTAGFARAAKRFDWAMAAMEAALAAGARFRWIHAGAERAEEYPLSAELAAHPRLAQRARITGYLSEIALEDHIAAADILLNLRFPSDGESSGTVARGFAAGACCILNATGAYAELPRDAVLLLPLVGTVPLLTQALTALAADPARAAEIGARGRRFAQATMALPVVGAAYREVIEATRDRPVGVTRRPADPGEVFTLPLETDPGAIAALLRDRIGPCQVLLEAPDLEWLTAATLDRPDLLGHVLPPEARLRGVRVVATPQPGLLLTLDPVVPG